LLFEQIKFNALGHERCTNSVQERPSGAIGDVELVLENTSLPVYSKRVAGRRYESRPKGDRLGKSILPIGAPDSCTDPRSDCSVRCRHTFRVVLDSKEAFAMKRYYHIGDVAVRRTFLLDQSLK
jgi:hypothetical protein